MADRTYRLYRRPVAVGPDKAIAVVVTRGEAADPRLQTLADAFLGPTACKVIGHDSTYRFYTVNAGAPGAAMDFADPLTGNSLSEYHFFSNLEDARAWAEEDNRQRYLLSTASAFGEDVS